MLDTHSVGESRAIATDFPPHYSTLLSTPSHSSARSAWLLWCGAKRVATISQIFADWLPGLPCSRDACPSLCCHWQAYRRSPDFLESFISLVLRFARVQTKACSGS